MLTLLKKIQTHRLRLKVGVLAFILAILALPGQLPAQASSEGRFPGLIAALQAKIGDHRLGVYVIPLDNPAAAFGINPDVQVPSASAWKGGGIIYFFEHADPAMLNSMPIG